jgi:hypothetical protein
MPSVPLAAAPDPVPAMASTIQPPTHLPRFLPLAFQDTVA